MRRRVVVVLLVVGVVSQSGLAVVGQSRPNLAQPQAETHVAWVVDVMRRMETIKVGSTRKELMAVFTTEGGLSTPLQRRFVSRDCPYFQSGCHLPSRWARD